MSWWVLRTSQLFQVWPEVVVVVSDLDRHLGLEIPRGTVEILRWAAEVITCRLHRRVYSSRPGKKLGQFDVGMIGMRWNEIQEMPEVIQHGDIIWQFCDVLCMVKSSMHSMLQHRPHGAPRVRMVRGSHVSPCPLSFSFHFAMAAGMITTIAAVSAPLPSQRNHEMSFAAEVPLSHSVSIVAVILHHRLSDKVFLEETP